MSEQLVRLERASVEAAFAEVMHHNLFVHMVQSRQSVDSTALYLQTQSCLRTRFRSKPHSRAGGLQALLQHSADSLLV